MDIRVNDAWFQVLEIDSSIISERGSVLMNTHHWSTGLYRFRARIPHERKCSLEITFPRHMQWRVQELQNGGGGA